MIVATRRTVIMLKIAVWVPLYVATVFTTYEVSLFIDALLGHHIIWVDAIIFAVLATTVIHIGDRLEQLIGPRVFLKRL